MKILIIEDESNIREVYAEVLRDVGYQVLEEGSGSSGLEAALTKEWDVMLLDIMLPGKDGLQVLSQIKKNDSLKNKPIILLTNLGKDNIMKEGYNLGAYSYIVKSEVNPGDVLDAVKQALMTQ